ncbi:MAG: fasciclin domain-containing protein [Cyclobacteriaceae bacterium]|nr:fasciclin domain-containing protein [Cyclobacteriaceae bacterium]MDH5249686.1 fasciclin domain-containing protein [Cyclobacteriaceae bacterium]
MKLRKSLTLLWAYNIRLLWLPIMLVAVSISSCDDNNSTPAPLGNIVEIAGKTSDLSTLYAAISKYPSLVNTLSAPGTFTVFAPTNAAFTAVLAAIGQTSIDDLPADVLENILQYHVHATAAIGSAAITPGPLGMVNGESAVLSTTNGVFIDNAQVTTPDVEASNGIIHIVDAVIVPPSMLPIVGTIVAPAYFNKNFTTLIAAVQNADTDILSLLLSDGPSGQGLTLFAPTNDAFEAAGITDVNSQDAVLAYHVIDGTVESADLPVTSGSAAEVETLGGFFYLSNSGGSVNINGLTQVIGVDIAGSNGVVHVINRTLLPPTKDITEIVSDAAAGNPAEFSLLLAALNRAGLTGALAGDGPFTVFAPTDAAFISAGLDEAAINAASPADVAAILTHHVVKASVYVFSTDLSDGNVMMLNDQEVTISVTNLTVQDAAGSTPPAGLVVSSLNILATNGVIHVIDKVLLPD